MIFFIKVVTGAFDDLLKSLLWLQQVLVHCCKPLLVLMIRLMMALA
jgi:hypothetical protein